MVQFLSLFFFAWHDISFSFSSLSAPLYFLSPSLFSSLSPSLPLPAMACLWLQAASETWPQAFNHWWSFFPPHRQASGQPRFTHVRQDLLIHSPGPSGTHTQKIQSKQRYAQTQIKSSQSVFHTCECVCDYVYFISPAIARPNQQLWAQIKAVKIKWNLTNKRRQTCLHWPQASTPDLWL